MALRAAQLFADVAVHGAGAAVSTLKGVAGEVDKTHASFNRIGKGGGELARGLGKITAVGGIAVAGLGLAAAKTGIDFEDAFAGVRKTVDGTRPQLDDLALGLRGLATRIPVKATDLAAIAQQAGALNVPRGSIVTFTDVISRLSAATTGLTTDVATDAFGKLGNVLHFSGPDYERVASSLVALGNAGASTEGDIIEVAKRFGAAGSSAKLTAAQVLGFSSAIASMGVEPEAAGSSLSRLFNNVTKYIGTGSDKIKSFAKVSGVSVKEFSALFAKDASGAMELFLQKLGQMDRFKASAALKAAGITNVRDINAVLLLSQNYGELKRQVDLSTTAFHENTALSEASALRFDTLKSKLSILRNQFTEGGLEVSEGFMPALSRLTGRVSAFLKLDTTKASLLDLGRKLGDALDRISDKIATTDWQPFIGAVKDVGGFLRQVLDILAKLPPQVDIAVASFLGLNKVSGGLLGKGLGDIAGGIAGGLGGLVSRGLASKLPGLGALVAQPVYITGVAPGVNLGGGLGGGLVDAAAGASLGTVALTLGSVAAIGAAFKFAMADSHPNMVRPEEGGTPGQVFDRQHGFGPWKPPPTGKISPLSILTGLWRRVEAARQLDAGKIRQFSDQSPAMKLEAIGQRLASLLVIQRTYEQRGDAHDATQIALLRQQLIKKTGVNITLHPQPVALNVDGRNLAIVQARYSLLSRAV